MADPKRRQERPRSRPLGVPRPDQAGPSKETTEGPHGSRSALHPSVEAEGAERWVQGKSEEELLADLRAYLARLRDDPHNIQDRLRVAAIQLRLGRIDEALIHYEGVVRGYVTHGQILSAIALCERILGIYPNLAHLQKLLAALYARAPRGTTIDSAVTPIHTLNEGFVVTDKLEVDVDVDPEDAVTDRNLVVDRLFSAPPPRQQQLVDDDDLRPTMRFAPVERAGDDSNPIPLTHPKRRVRAAEEDTDDGPTDDGPTDDGPTDDGPTNNGDAGDGDPNDGEGRGMVVLLTQPKKKS